MGGGTAFPEGPELLPFYSNSPIFHRLARVRESTKGAGGGAEKSPNSPNGPRISDHRTRVKEEGAVERGRENRLARATKSLTKSSFDHAVKSFNIVDAFGQLSCTCSAVHDFVKEDVLICMPRIAPNCNTAVVPRSTRDRGVAALAS